MGINSFYKSIILLALIISSSVFADEINSSQDLVIKNFRIMEIGNEAASHAASNTSNKEVFRSYMNLSSVSNSVVATVANAIDILMLQEMYDCNPSNSKPKMYVKMKMAEKSQYLELDVKRIDIEIETYKNPQFVNLGSRMKAEIITIQELLLAQSK